MDRVSIDEALEAADQQSPFDFKSHRDTAVEAYRSKRGGYEDLARAVRAILEVAISRAGIKVQSIDERAKTEDSFGAKVARPKDAEGLAPKYEHPLREIQDLAGCRVITFFLDDVQTIRGLIHGEFEVLEMTNRSSHLRGAGRPGYESFHFIVRMSAARLALPEYSRYGDMVAEIQVRTILQHAWAEIEHDIQYKSVDALPAEIGQRFQALAGLIEIGDREFQAIADAHESVRTAAAISLEAGRLAEVELTAESLKAYLDKNLGPDGRIRDWAYEWTASYLRNMGFINLQQLHDCVDGYNDDHVSRVVWGSRQGQLTRFELLLLAGMGADKFRAMHPYARMEDAWFREGVEERARALADAGISIGNYSPSHE